jgi:hypothetical protein
MTRAIKNTLGDPPAVGRFDTGWFTAVPWWLHRERKACVMELFGSLREKATTKSTNFPECANNANMNEINIVTYIIHFI